MRLLLLTLLLTSACTSSEASTRCQEMAAHPLQGITPAKAVDYVGIARSRSSDPSSSTGVFDRIGERPCSMASDPKTCLALVESLENGTGWSTESATETMVATVKDDVISYQGPQDLLRLLGPIDSEEKAALLARSTGRELACGYGPVREIEGGYRLTTRRFGCVETVHVTTEGRIIDNAEPTADFGPCPSAVDAGFVDTGVSIDTGPFDTGVFDTGAVTTLDSTTVDSAGPDDGPAVDAGGE